MEGKKKIVIKNSDGTTMEVDLVTYLIRDDHKGAYLVYSKDEKAGEENDRVIYVSKIIPDKEVCHLGGISDDNEWLEVQNLLKKIANA